MLNFANTLSYNNYRQRLIGGTVGGIFDSGAVFYGLTTRPLPRSAYMTGEFSHFERHIHTDMPEMTYHLSGYGMSRSEAMVSFVGEASERLSYVAVSKLYESRIIRSSYEELSRNAAPLENVLPLEYVNVNYNEASEGNYVRGSDSISWIRLNSLVSEGASVLVPLQMFSPHSPHLFREEKRITRSAVSTGTASHETIEASVRNAVIECMQIDSFNLWWYGGLRGSAVDIDVQEILSEFIQNRDELRRFLDSFNVRFSDISFDKSVDVIVCEIFGRDSDVPQYTVGVQGGEGLRRVIYRAFMECFAVLEYGFNVPWMMTDRYRECGQQENVSINNLDDNVIWFAKFGKPDHVRHDVDPAAVLEIPTSHETVGSRLSHMSRYAGSLDISLPDFEGLNLNVGRVVIPELIPMCMPSSPQRYHPRYAQVGGIRNDFIHPLA